MRPPFVRTVLGDIAASDLGTCYAHEHVIIEAGYPTDKTPDFLINDVERAAAELADVYAIGGRAMIDSMPADAGRNVLKLAAVSRASRIHIVCPTGVHLDKYYPPGHWSGRLTAERLAQLFSADITEGIDANDYGGPTVERTPHRAGVIKVASSLDRLTPREERIFEAAAIAHHATGAPILTHTEAGTAALEQIATFERHRVPLRHVCLSHTDRKHDLAYHRQILASGVRVEYDSAFRWQLQSPEPQRGEMLQTLHLPNHTLELVTNLLPEFPDQIMLGMDAARRSYWKHYGGAPGLTYLLDRFVPELRAAGVPEDLIARMFVSTPADCFSFAPVAGAVQTEEVP